MFARLGIDDGAFPSAESGVEEFASAPVGNETQVMTVRLVGDEQSAVFGLGSHLGLEVSAQREERPLQLLLH